jgi:hypothetical protein
VLLLRSQSGQGSRTQVTAPPSCCRPSDIANHSPQHARRGHRDAGRGRSIRAVATTGSSGSLHSQLGTFSGLNQPRSAPTSLRRSHFPKICSRLRFPETTDRRRRNGNAGRSVECASPAPVTEAKFSCQRISRWSAQHDMRRLPAIKDRRCPQFRVAARARNRLPHRPLRSAGSGVPGCLAAHALGGTAIKQWRFTWLAFKSLSFAPR